ncbi:MAG: MlaD family protein [Treponema sp.]|jgi:phospholipid/cholesterol/gamma-HCH transport system substrate-binding protein|nr:MlaD family protein [Treponema sp.]
MKFSIRFADQVVGVLVILALAILVVVIFMLGKTQRWFVKDYQYTTYFNSASGLSSNMAVTYKGFTMGHVKKIMLTEDDRVEVVFTIFNEHNYRVKQGSLVELQASPIGLGNSFIFHPGKGSIVLPEGSVIPEVNSSQAKQLASMGLTDRPESTDSINNIINNVNMLIDTINRSLAGMEGADELTLGQIISGLNNTVQTISTRIDPIMNNLQIATGGISGQIDPVMTNIHTLTDQMAKPSGTAMSILDAEGPVFTSIAGVLESINGIMKNLDKTAEFIPAQLPQISLLISDLKSAVVEIEKMVIALNNNPLLKGGVPELKETGPGAATPRDLEF